ncbi:MAG: M15 family metallopeptidase [Candidatus Gracilibacteria bacterium]|jgi:D-alanyl-D-alanine dipeptidase
MENVMSIARQSILIKDCGEKLVPLDGTEFVLEPKYFEWGFSENPKILLREGIVEKLREVKKSLQKISGCGDWNLKIWDGYRTLSVQKILYNNYYEILKKENPDWPHEKLCEHVEMFVAPPSRNAKSPSPHNTGGVIDLTLVDSQNNEVLMGSAFDEFNEKSFSYYYDADSGNGNNDNCKIFQKNRLILKRVMEEFGFVNYPDEWWHFSYGDQLWAYLKKQPFAIYGSVEI